MLDLLKKYAIEKNMHGLLDNETLLSTYEVLQVMRKRLINYVIVQKELSLNNTNKIVENVLLFRLLSEDKTSWLPTNDVVKQVVELMMNYVIVRTVLEELVPKEDGMYLPTIDQVQGRLDEYGITTPTNYVQKVLELLNTDGREPSTMIMEMLQPTEHEASKQNGSLSVIKPDLRAGLIPLSTGV